LSLETDKAIEPTWDDIYSRVSLILTLWDDKSDKRNFKIMKYPHHSISLPCTWANSVAFIKLSDYVCVYNMHVCVSPDGAAHCDMKKDITDINICKVKERLEKPKFNETL